MLSQFRQQTWKLHFCPWLGTMLTILFLLFAWFYGNYFGLSLSPTFLFVTISVFCGGIWWGLVSGGLVIIFEILVLWPEQPGRLLLVSLTILGVIWLVTILQRKAEQLDSLNGGVIKLRQATADLADLLAEWDLTTKPALKRQLLRIYDKIADVTTTVWLWRQLKQEIDEVKTAYHVEESDAEL